MADGIDGNADLLGQVLASLPDIVLLVDREGVIRYINRVEPGYDRDAVVGARVDGFVAPGSQDVSTAALAAAFDRGQASEYEVEIPSPEGSRTWFRSRVFPLRDGGEVVHAVIVGTDVTELKAAQEVAAKLRRLLPICSWCDRIQTGEGTWVSIERYLGDRLETKVTHGMCPRCYAREMGGEASERGGDVA